MACSYVFSQAACTNNMNSPDKSLIIRGAREHNLKDISLYIPKNKLVVITGPSGSGKSSLAFDTIYAEAQRLFVESLSTHSHQFFSCLKRPDVDSIEGLTPAIAIAQSSGRANPRSTLATLSEIYDYLRVLYTRLGKAWCTSCQKNLEYYSVQQIADRILALEAGIKIQLFAPVSQTFETPPAELIEELRGKGFVRIRINDQIHSLEDDIQLAPEKKHQISVIVDRIVTKDGIRARVYDSIETCIDLSNGLVGVLQENSEEVFSTHPACLDCGLSLPQITPALFSFNSPQGACTTCQGLGQQQQDTCKNCLGSRLKPEVQMLRIAETDITSLCKLTVNESSRFLSSLSFPKAEEQVARELLDQILNRLTLLQELGLNYLRLDRSTPSLSGGELSRIRLARQLGSRLSGILYVLDEPSIGLHPSDHGNLLRVLEKLRGLGNSILLVEHNENSIRAADQIIDLGPKAGRQGGKVLFQGSAAELEKNESDTGQYLSRKKRVYQPESRRTPGTKKILLRNSKVHNLKGFDTEIPLGLFTCISGVSGAGKSSLIHKELVPTLKKVLNGRALERLSGAQYLDNIISIDQAPLGKSPRSNAATYSGIFDLVRRVFSETNQARVRGFDSGRFSFNVQGGRCEDCQGAGLVRVELHFLPDAFVPCETCQGCRYNRDTLEIRYRGLSIADVLNLRVSEAAEFFSAHRSISAKLTALLQVGLGYLPLGQAASTLSGGEAQRVKLAAELAKKNTGSTLYVLDEPSCGLHSADIDTLLQILHRLVDQGNTLIVIEHQLEIIQSADWVIDLGPEGGDKGGHIVAQGAPEEVAQSPNSKTGLALRKCFGEDL